VKEIGSMAKETLDSKCSNFSSNL